jgi:hypothetical protein
MSHPEGGEVPQKEDVMVSGGELCGSLLDNLKRETALSLSIKAI